MSDAATDLPDAAALAETAARHAAGVIAGALAARGRAFVALPGGRSPRAALRRLAALTDWRGVTIIPTDERLAPPGDALSNGDMLADLFEPVGARVVRIDGAAAPGLWPLDLAWLGMGADGHTASIFPGPDLAAALAPDAPPLLRVRPDPPPPEAPVARVSLSLRAIAAARHVMLTLSGPDKRAVLDRALAAGAASPFPVGRVLAALPHPAAIFRSPA